MLVASNKEASNNRKIERCFKFIYIIYKFLYNVYNVFHNLLRNSMHFRSKFLIRKNYSA